MLLRVGSKEGITLCPTLLAVLRSKQKTLLFGVQESVAKTYLEVSPTLDTTDDCQGNKISSLTSRNYRSQSRRVPPISPTRHNFLSTVKADIKSGLVMTSCCLVLVSSITMNLPAGYTTYSFSATRVKNSYEIACDWVHPYMCLIVFDIFLNFSIVLSCRQSLSMRSLRIDSGYPTLPITQSLQTETTQQPIQQMVQQLTHQVRQLLGSQDIQSLKYLISDQSKQAIEAVCANLAEKQKTLLLQLYGEVLEEEGKNAEPFNQLSSAEKNKNIDEYLLKSSEKEEKEENILEMMTKVNQKLIYDEHFGFPYFDLVKRIMSTSGDINPNIQSVKSVHSQVQLLYGILFSSDVLKVIKERYESSHEGISALVELVFKKECERYHNFLEVYKNIKKTTQDEQDSEDISLRQIPLKDDNTLYMDEKQFLVELAERLPIDEFNQFVKNRSYNFLCFGLKKYQTFLGLTEEMMGRKKKQFGQLLSFVTVRFIRNIVFTIIKDRGGGKLMHLKEPLTTNQIKARGNQITDQISEKVDKFCQPITSIDDEAKAIFLEEFETMRYQDFIPRQYITEANKKGSDVALYTWQSSKEYKTLWGQRVKAERYIIQSQKVQKPKIQYIDFILQNYQKFKENRKDLWKRFIMNKFGYVQEKTTVSTKRVKLNSLNH